MPLEKVASFFVPWRLPNSPRQSVVHDDTRVTRSSVVNTGGTDDSVATDGPHRPTVGSRPWTSPAKEPAGGGFICSANNFLRIDLSAIGQAHPAHALLTENKRFDSCFEMDRLPRQTRDQLLRQTSHPARRKQRPSW